MGNSKREIREHMKTKSQEDLQRLIRAVLDTPMTDGEVTYIDDEHSLAYYQGKNMDIKTRIVVQQSILAANGSDKAATFLFKYGALEPPKEQHVTVEPHTFIDDITCATEEEESTEDLENESDEEFEED